ncbi:MAG: sulfatase-like hydrolase/transferase [Pontiella sp.]
MKKIIICVAVFFVSSSFLLAVGEAKRTNFIQILTDDQGWGDLKSFGHDRILSPNIDRLAKEGLKFTSCYSSDAVCSPSRSSIITGRTPFRNGVYRWIRPSSIVHLPAKEVTLPQLLRKAGYQTSHFGKWHLSWYAEKREKSKGYYDFVLGSPDQPSMGDYGYDYWLATGNVARPNHKTPVNFFLNGKPLGETKGFSAQIVAKQIEHWMNHVRKPGEPFFMTVWFHEPHGPINSDPIFLARYSDKIKDPALKQYFANITQIDEAVGAIVDCLKKNNVYDDTLIWYTSDNGPEGDGYGSYNTKDSPSGNSRYRGTTGGLRGRKRHTYEGGVRVPGIISWPAGLKAAGVLPGNVVATPIIGSDVFPTMLELAGLEPPKDVVLDGASIVPLLQGGTLERARPLYWRNLSPLAIAIRRGDWKIAGNSQRTKFELYNLHDDPRETTNLAPYHPELFEKMKKELIAYDKEVLAEGPDWWKSEEDLKKNIPVK